MQATVVDFAKDQVIYNITGCTKEELENKLNLFFTSEKLVLKTDTPDEKVFQKGSKAMRIFFGIFVKYFKITVSLTNQGNQFSVKLFRDMNFIMSGGLIGIQSARKEFERINEAFKTYFNH
jgi:hypothetical protein